MNAIIEQARSLDGYQDSSELLQRRDQDWVLDRAGIEPRSLLDLGCGIEQGTPLPSPRASASPTAGLAYLLNLDRWLTRHGVDISL